MNPFVFVLLAAGLIGAAFYLVALPLLQEARRNAHPAPIVSEQERLNELLAQRDAAFQALRELSFDYKVGKITDDDFSAFEAGLKQNAANTLRALDEWEATSELDLDALMEDAILTHKSTLVAPEAAEPDGRQCARCDQPVLTGDKFCAGCGASLPAAVSLPARQEVQPACPNCGQPHAPADRFCARCGQTLAAEVAPVG